MSAGNAEVLARLRLVAGWSDSELREFARSQGAPRLLKVGAALNCDWCVRDDGVTPVHFLLHWDGATLRIAAPEGSGTVRIDGELLGADFRRLASRTRIEFGRAAIVAEISSLSVRAERRADADAEFYRSGLSSLPPPASLPPQVVSSSQLPARAPNGGGSNYPPTEDKLGPRRTLPRHTLMDGTPILLKDFPSIQVPSTTRNSEHPGGRSRTALVVDARAQHDDAARLPKTVLVLSPLSSSPQTTGMERARLSSVPPPPISSWARVLLAFLALAGFYAGWLYLLYTL